MLRKVVSGGQTGVDRAGLDAAVNAGFPIGGYCPKGRSAEATRPLWKLQEVQEMLW